MLNRSPKSKFKEYIYMRRRGIWAKDKETLICRLGGYYISTPYIYPSWNRGEPV